MKFLILTIALLTQLVFAQTPDQQWNFNVSMIQSHVNKARLALHQSERLQEKLVKGIIVNKKVLSELLVAERQACASVYLAKRIAMLEKLQVEGNEISRLFDKASFYCMKEVLSDLDMYREVTRMEAAESLLDIQTKLSTIY